MQTSQHGPRIAVIGCGPRGIAFLERLAEHLSRARRQGHVDRPTVVVIDSTELGAGRVWSTEQPPWLTMNTVIGEITMAPPSPGVVPLPGFEEWLRGRQEPHVDPLGPHDYAPRALYGRYLKDVYDQVLDSLRHDAEVVEVLGTVTALHEEAPGYLLEVVHESGTEQWTASTVVLATGHHVAGPNDPRNDFDHFAEEHDLNYLSGGLASELDLDTIEPGTQVGVVGLGLTFYDVLMALTIGRGGEFVTEGDTVRYRPSGKEPVLHAGSRSGVPLATRGHNQKGRTPSFRPRILTASAVNACRHNAIALRGDPRLDFADEVLPLLLAEVELVRAETELAAVRGTSVATDFANAYVAAGHEPSRRDQVLRDYELGAVAPGLLGMARPFANTRFASPDEFTRAVRAIVEDDLAEALLGNIDGPLKAAQDVVRDLRDLIRAVVEGGGLVTGRPGEDFTSDIAPALSLISTGPPPERTRQFLALMAAGVVNVVGPDLVFGADRGRGSFYLESPRVGGSRTLVHTLLDARVSRRATDPVGDDLISGLLRDQLARPFPAPGLSPVAAGIAVHPATGRVISGDGTLREGLYATGVVTEGVKWFTQIGNGRPNTRTAFHREADAIAIHVVRLLMATTFPYDRQPAIASRGNA